MADVAKDSGGRIWRAQRVRALDPLLRPEPLFCAGTDPEGNQCAAEVTLRCFRASKTRAYFASRPSTRHLEHCRSASPIRDDDVRGHYVGLHSSAVDEFSGVVIHIAGSAEPTPAPILPRSRAGSVHRMHHHVTTGTGQTRLQTRKLSLLGILKEIMSGSVTNRDLVSAFGVKGPINEVIRHPSEPIDAHPHAGPWAEGFLIRGIVGVVTRVHEPRDGRNLCFQIRDLNSSPSSRHQVRIYLTHNAAQELNAVSGADRAKFINRPFLAFGRVRYTGGRPTETARRYLEVTSIRHIAICV